MFTQQDKKKLMELLHRVGVKKGEEEIFIELDRRYRERHRVYHTAEHIRHCLAEFKPVRDMLLNPDAVELAIWFHDAIFASGASDNEALSTQLAQKKLWMVDVPHEVRVRVADLIMATRHDGRLSPRDPDAIMMADINLSSLGAYPQMFDENAQRLRREMRLSNEEFFKRQAIFLVKLFQRYSIYGTTFFYKKYERQARKNIERFALRAGVAIR